MAERASYTRCHINGHGLEPQSVSAVMSPKFNRQSDKLTAELIRVIWERRTADNPRLFDGSKFRLHSIERNPNKLVLNLGLTSYGQFLGTNCAEDAKVVELRGMGRNMFQDPQAFFSDALGVGALLETSDEKLVFLRRSLNCGEAQGLVDRPGGHAEPQMVPGIEDFNGVHSELVVREIFDSIRREVIDEVNISGYNLSDPLLIGFVYNHTTASRPSAEFIIRCPLSSEKILQDFKTGTQAEADESTGIIFFNKNHIFDLRNDSVWDQMAPAAQGSLLLYCDFLKSI